MEFRSRIKKPGEQFQARGSLWFSLPVHILFEISFVIHLKYCYIVL